MILKKPTTRRRFFGQISASALTLASANTIVYAVGSAFKSLDGSMVAGAKCAGSPPPEPVQCPDTAWSFYRVCEPGYYTCSGTTWMWSPPTCAKNGPIYDDCM